MNRMLRILVPVTHADERRAIAQGKPSLRTLHTPLARTPQMAGKRREYHVIGTSNAIRLRTFCTQHGILFESVLLRVRYWPPGDHGAPFWDQITYLKARMRLDATPASDSGRAILARQVRFLARKARHSSQRLINPGAPVPSRPKATFDRRALPTTYHNRGRKLMPTNPIEPPTLAQIAKINQNIARVEGPKAAREHERLQQEAEHAIAKQGGARSPTRDRRES